MAVFHRRFQKTRCSEIGASLLWHTPNPPQCAQPVPPGCDVDSQCAWYKNSVRSRPSISQTRVTQTWKLCPPQSGCIRCKRPGTTGKYEKVGLFPEMHWGDFSEWRENLFRFEEENLVFRCRRPQLQREGSPLRWFLPCISLGLVRLAQPARARPGQGLVSRLLGKEGAGR